MPTLIAVDGNRIDVPPGILQHDLDAEHDTLVALGLVIRSAAEVAFAKAQRLDVLGRRVRPTAGAINELATVMAEAVSQSLQLTGDGERSLMMGVR